MSGLKGWVLVLGILAVVFWGVHRVVTQVEKTSEQLAPLQRMNASLSTQVARVLNPTPTIRPDPVTIVHRIRKLARLETVQYTIEKVITAEAGPDAGLGSLLFGDRLLFVAHGRVLAGVDLSKIGPEDVGYEGDTLVLRLPPPEIFVVALDNEKSYVYDRETGLLTKGQVHLETEARRAAEKALLEAALEDGILDKARLHAEAFLVQFLHTLGFPQVRIVFERATPTVPPSPAPAP